MAKQSEKTLSGTHYTLEGVAIECIHFTTAREDIKTQQGTLSDHFMSAAQVYIKAPKKGEEMQEDHPFLVACEKVESFMKSEAAGINQWDKIPAVWSQLKSNMKAAFNLGMDINAFDTESSMRKELNERRKAKKAETVSPEQKALEQAQEAVSELVEKGDTALSQRIFAIVEACRKATPDQLDDVIAVLDSATSDIKAILAVTAELPKAKQA